VIRHCMDEMTERIGGDGGAIAIDTKGTIAIGFNSKRMAWAYAVLDDEEDDNSFTSKTLVQVHSGCNREEHYVNDLPLA